MVKHNKAIDCNQFRKDIHPLIKTWFNQPAKKLRRRKVRQEKARLAGENALINTLKPFVNACGQKHNYKLRAGRGFTPEELKAANLTIRGARSIRISVDLRRRNNNKECFDRNVERLKNYLSNVTLVTARANPVQNKGGVPVSFPYSQVGKPSETIVRLSNKPSRTSSVLVA